MHIRISPEIGVAQTLFVRHTQKLRNELSIVELKLLFACIVDRPTHRLHLFSSEDDEDHLPEFNRHVPANVWPGIGFSTRPPNSPSMSI